MASSHSSSGIPGTDQVLKSQKFPKSKRASRRFAQRRSQDAKISSVAICHSEAIRGRMQCYVIILSLLHVPRSHCIKLEFWDGLKPVIFDFGLLKSRMARSGGVSSKRTGWSRTRRTRFAYSRYVTTTERRGRSRFGADFGQTVGWSRGQKEPCILGWRCRLLNYILMVL